MEDARGGDEREGARTRGGAARARELAAMRRLALTPSSSPGNGEIEHGRFGALGTRRPFSPALSSPRRMNSVLKRDGANNRRGAARTRAGAGVCCEQATEKDLTHAFEFDMSNPSMKRSESSIDMTMRDVSDGSAASATTVVGVGERGSHLRSAASAVDLRELGRGQMETLPLSHIGGQERAKQRERPKTREEQRGNLGSDFVEADYAEGVPDPATMKGRLLEISSSFASSDGVVWDCVLGKVSSHRSTRRVQGDAQAKAHRRRRDASRRARATRAEDINDGPFIDKLLHAYQDQWALFLVLEYAPCGDLFQAMNYHGLPTLHDAKMYTRSARSPSITCTSAGTSTET